MLSPATLKAVQDAAKADSAWMTPFEKSLATAAGLIGVARYRSALTAVRSGHKLTARQAKSLAQLLRAVADNPAVKVLENRGRALERNPRQLAADLARLQNQSLAVPSKLPSTGSANLDRVLAKIASAVDSSSAVSTSNRFTALLGKFGAVQFGKMLSPLDAAQLIPAQDLATYTVPMVERAAASKAPPSAPTQSSVHGAGLLVLVHLLTTLTPTAEDAGIAAIHNTDPELADKVGAILDLNEAAAGSGLTLSPTSPAGVWGLAHELEDDFQILEDGVIPPKLRLTSALGATAPTIVAGDSDSFIVTGFTSDGHFLGYVPFGTGFGDATLQIDGRPCPGGTCTTTTAGRHTVTATVGSSSASLTLTVLSAQIESVNVQEVIPPFADPSSLNVVGAPQSYVVSATDKYDNPITDATFTLTITPNGRAPASCAGLSCTPTALGQNTITAAATNAITGSVTITVTPKSLSLSPSSASVTAGQAQALTVDALDANGNDVGPDPNATLSITPDGSCSGYTCTPATDGDHTVTARDGSATGRADLTVDSNVPAPGSYSGSSSQGQGLSLSVSDDGTQLQDVTVRTLLVCTPSMTLDDRLQFASIPIAADGSFAGTGSQTGVLDNTTAQFTYTFNGQFTGTTVTGQLREDITFNNGTAFSCTSDIQTWSASRDTQGTQSNSPPPPGSYSGSSSQGQGLSLYVSDDGTQLQDVTVRTVLVCTPSMTLDDRLQFASISIAADGSFAGTGSETGVIDNATAQFTYTFAGHVHGTASDGTERLAGQLREDITFNNGSAFSCTSNIQTWSATRDTQGTQSNSPPPPGSYSGSSSQGQALSLSVSSDSTQLEDVTVRTVLVCTPSMTLDDRLQFASIPIAADGSFSATASQSGMESGSAAQFTYTFAGHFHGTASNGSERVAGQLREDITFNNGTAFSCTSNIQTWSATGP
jgi:lipoprotein signal peptidase